ncbi:hypothetical protein, partial [Cronobacter dublinensis]|uniref:hypothetical protein n=1 Tax=Cronobacter dublinensis TaxID=413497 RepID=UPI001F3B17CF
AFDHCLLQKILPRISGSDARVQRALEQLFTFCTGIELNGEYAFDHCLLQKILPRISGSDARVQRALEQLFTFC